MKYLGFLVKHVGVLLLVATGLGACSSAMDYSTSISDKEAYRIGKSITSEEERVRLISMLNKVKRDHHAKALDEIATR